MVGIPKRLWLSEAERDPHALSHRQLAPTDKASVLLRWRRAKAKADAILRRLRAKDKAEALLRRIRARTKANAVLRRLGN